MNMIFNCRNNGIVNCEVHYIRNNQICKCNFVLSETQKDYKVFFRKWKSGGEMYEKDNIFAISNADIICIKIP